MAQEDRHRLAWGALAGAYGLRFLLSKLHVPWRGSPSLVPAWCPSARGVCSQQPFLMGSLGLQTWQCPNFQLAFYSARVECGLRLQTAHPGSPPHHAGLHTDAPSRGAWPAQWAERATRATLDLCREFEPHAAGGDYLKPDKRKPLTVDSVRPPKVSPSPPSPWLESGVE